MRVVVGSEGSPTSRQADLERHLDALARFVERRKRISAPECTLVLRSARSVPAQALTLMKDALADASIRAKAVVARLEPTDDLKQICDTLRALSPEADPAALIRWAREPRLLEAHEQVTYGLDMCWTGDAMRRDADKRNPLTLFDMDATGATARALHAFKALWNAAVPVPKRHLGAPGPVKPSGAYERADDAPLPATREPIQGWPLVRH